MRSNDNGPQCPYCGYEHDPLKSNYDLDTVADKAPLTCVGCKRQFHCIVYRSVDWDSWTLEELPGVKP